MTAHIQDAKATVRRRVRQDLKAMTEAQRAGASAQARALLAAQAHWREAQAILFFAPSPEELNVWPLLGEALRAGKKVFLPRFVDADERPLKRFADPRQPANTPLKQGVNESGLPAGRGSYVVCEVTDPNKNIRPGQFGIREPAGGCAELPLNRLDLILVPGVAFDLHGRRLGRGKGFYDQLLAAIRGRTCGVAFDQQIVGEIPVEPHDVHLNCILTPTRWIEL
jgi:5-formyltetrahydrofolate cyclo-ligase